MKFIFPYRAGVALQSLQSGIDDIKELTSGYGPNKEWTNPSLVLWQVESNIDDLLDKILLKLKVVSDNKPTIKISCYFIILI